MAQLPSSLLRPFKQSTPWRVSFSVSLSVALLLLYFSPLVDGYVTIYAKGAERPLASALNFGPAFSACASTYFAVGKEGSNIFISAPVRERGRVIEKMEDEEEEQKKKKKSDIFLDSLPARCVWCLHP